MPDYSKGKIYKIVNTENDKVYIGSTIMTLGRRMSVHRYHAINLNCPYGRLYKSMRYHGVKKFRIILVKDFSCDTEQQLVAKEFQIIKKYVANGVVLYNSTTEKGKMSDATKAKMRRRTGVANSQFKRGCVGFYESRNSWNFQWQENGRKRLKSFSAKKYGYDEAKRLVEEYRDKVYPID